MSDKLREALTGLLAIVDESEGVAGYHLNGEIAEWDTFAEVDAAREALAEAQPAQQSQWVPSSKQLPPLDIPVWLSDEGRGVFIGMRSSSTDGWLWAECDTYRFFGGQWESIEAHFDDFEPSCWMPLPAAPGDTAAPEQADSQDELREEIGGLKSVNTTLVQALKRLTFHARTTGGTAGPDAGLMEACEQAEHALSLGGFGRAYMEGADAAPEQAEQPASYVDDLIERLGDAQQEINLAANTTMSQALCSASALLDEVEVALRRYTAPPAAEQDAVKVPRGLLECYLNGGGDWVEAGHKLRDLLGGGA